MTNDDHPGRLRVHLRPEGADGRDGHPGLQAHQDRPSRRRGKDERRCSSLAALSAPCSSRPLRSPTSPPRQRAGSRHDVLLDAIRANRKALVAVNLNLTDEEAEELLAALRPLPGADECGAGSAGHGDRGLHHELHRPHRRAGDADRRGLPRGRGRPRKVRRNTSPSSPAFRGRRRRASIRSRTRWTRSSATISPRRSRRRAVEGVPRRGEALRVRASSFPRPTPARREERARQPAPVADACRASLDILVLPRLQPTWDAVPHDSPLPPAWRLFPGDTFINSRAGGRLHVDAAAFATTGHIDGIAAHIGVRPVSTPKATSLLCLITASSGAQHRGAVSDRVLVLARRPSGVGVTVASSPRRSRGSA